MPQKEEFQCPSNIANGNYADPVTCRRFYQCVDGFPYLNRCPSGLYFDDVQKFCTFKDEAKCGPLSTMYSCTNKTTKSSSDNLSQQMMLVHHQYLTLTVIEKNINNFQNFLNPKSIQTLMKANK
uniref:Chitin-binding type-2 domain-containing protein n=1 Tax=Glossina brevipalpis TaxID=37001 RepID=A0A1A9WPM0_9MUSC